jgi:hypothetical protein
MNIDNGDQQSRVYKARKNRRLLRPLRLWGAVWLVGATSLLIPGTAFGQMERQQSRLLRAAAQRRMWLEGKILEGHRMTKVDRTARLTPGRRMAGVSSSRMQDPANRPDSTCGLLPGLAAVVPVATLLGLPAAPAQDAYAVTGDLLPPFLKAVVSVWNQEFPGVPLSNNSLIFVIRPIEFYADLNAQQKKMADEPGDARHSQLSVDHQPAYTGRRLVFPCSAGMEAGKLRCGVYLTDFHIPRNRPHAAGRGRTRCLQRTTSPLRALCKTRQTLESVRARVPRFVARTLLRREKTSATISAGIGESTAANGCSARTGGGSPASIRS